MSKKPINVIVICSEKAETIMLALKPENYPHFPIENTYSVSVKKLEEVADDLDENTVLVISDYPNVDVLVKLVYTEKAPKTICIGDYSRKDRVELGGMSWCDKLFFMSTILPATILFIVSGRN